MPDTKETAGASRKPAAEAVAKAVTNTEPENKPSAAATTAPTTKTFDMAPRIESFTGTYMTRVRRTEVIDDPASPGRKMTNRKDLAGPAHGVVQAVIGYGKFSNTGEPYVSVLVQYQPGKTTRVTFSAQNAKIFSDALLKGNVNDSSGKNAQDQIHWPLIKEAVISAFGTEMRVRGVLAEECYIHRADGSREVVIGAAQTDAEAEAVGNQFF